MQDLNDLNDNPDILATETYTLGFSEEVQRNILGGLPRDLQSIKLALRAVKHPEVDVEHIYWKVSDDRGDVECTLVIPRKRTPEPIPVPAPDWKDELNFNECYRQPSDFPPPAPSPLFVPDDEPDVLPEQEIQALQTADLAKPIEPTPPATPPNATTKKSLLSRIASLLFS